MLNTTLKPTLYAPEPGDIVKIVPSVGSKWIGRVLGGPNESDWKEGDRVRVEDLILGHIHWVRTPIMEKVK